MTTSRYPEEADRSLWESGPWDDEPDRAEWVDEVTGLPCLITRHSMFGFLCGYVAVPPGHPLHGATVDQLERLSLNAHGGVNYANFCSGKVCHVPAPGEPDNVYWFGFDCGHLHDDMPGGGPKSISALMRKAHMIGSEGAVYRNFAFVVGECQGLALQLMHYTKNPPEIST